jgi:predicted nucleic acid-binding protein
MKKPKLYLDTSVISYLEAPDTPEKMADTQRLWELLKTNAAEVFLSAVDFIELNHCDEPKRSQMFEYLTQIHYTHLSDDPAVDDLADKLINFGILKETSRDDCRHIAFAVLSGCDMIVSWKFNHIVNPKTIRGVKAITITEGYKDLLICTPSMIIEGGVFNEP